MDAEEYRKVEVIMEKAAKGFPASALSVEELKTFGTVAYHDSEWCVLIYYSPLEGIGYGNAVIYKKNTNKWSMHKASERILIPKAKISDNKIIITKEKTLNDRSRVEDFQILMNE